MWAGTGYRGTGLGEPPINWVPFRINVKWSQPNEIGLRGAAGLIQPYEVELAAVGQIDLQNLFKALLKGSSH